MDGELIIELKGEKHGELLICVCSNKLKFSCKYASQLKPELNFHKVTKDNTLCDLKESGNKIYLYKKTVFI